MMPACVYLIVTELLSLFFCLLAPCVFVCVCVCVVCLFQCANISKDKDEFHHPINTILRVEIGAIHNTTGKQPIN